MEMHRFVKTKQKIVLVKDKALDTRCYNWLQDAAGGMLL
jgi:hypothetical protein